MTVDALHITSYEVFTAHPHNTLSLQATCTAQGCHKSRGFCITMRVCCEALRILGKKSDDIEGFREALVDSWARLSSALACSLAFPPTAHFDRIECFAIHLDAWMRVFIGDNIRSTETSSG